MVEKSEIDLIEKDLNDTDNTTSSQILEIVKFGSIWSPTEIREGLFHKGKDISYTGVTKQLDKMVNRKEIAFLPNNAANREYIKLLLKKPVNDMIDKYYIYTPLSYDFYKKLNDVVIKLDKKKYESKISDIVDIFRVFELGSYLQHIYMINSNIIKKDLKKGGKIKGNITKEIIELKKEQAQADIQNFFHEEISVRLLIDHIKIKEGDKEFLLINDYHVPLDRLVKFMRLMHFNEIMYWFVFGHKVNLENYVFPLVDMMKEFFVEINNDSQIKV